MTRKKPEPCPFCGSRNVQRHVLGGSFRVRKVIRCQQCLATGPIKTHFVAAWNRRWRAR